MTPGPTFRSPRLVRVTTWIQSYFAAYSARMAGVSSVLPSSTMIHRAGGQVWFTMLSSVRRAKSASSRVGLIRQ